MTTVALVQPDVEFLSPDLGRRWSIRTRELPSFEFAWHAHDEFELTVIVEGTGRRFGGNGASVYHPGDVALFGPRLPHTYVSDAGVHQRAYVIHFAGDVLSGLLDSPEFGPVASLLQDASRGVVAPAPGPRLQRAFQTLSELTGMAQTLALLNVLVELAQDDTTALSTPDPVHRGLSPESAAVINAVASYLQANYRRPVSLEEIATALALSPSTVSRLMRRHVGTSVTDYLLNLRLDAACRELVDTDRPISTLAHDCGFANLANFNRHFKRRRAMTPREYRRTFRV